MSPRGSNAPTNLAWPREVPCGWGRGPHCVSCRRNRRALPSAGSGLADPRPRLEVPVAAWRRCGVRQTSNPLETSP